MNPLDFQIRKEIWNSDIQLPKKVTLLLTLVIRTVSETKAVKIAKEAEPINSEALTQKVMIFAEKQREEHLDQMMNILMAGATSQDEYLSDYKEPCNQSDENKETEFFDI